MITGPLGPEGDLRVGPPPPLPHSPLCFLLGSVGNLPGGAGGTAEAWGGAPCWTLKASWSTDHPPPITDQPRARGLRRAHWPSSREPTGPSPPRAEAPGVQRSKGGRKRGGVHARSAAIQPPADLNGKPKRGGNAAGESSPRHLSFFTCCVLETNKGSFQKKRIVSYKDICQVTENAVGGPLSVCPGGPRLIMGGPRA